MLSVIMNTYTTNSVFNNIDNTFLPYNYVYLIFPYRVTFLISDISIKYCVYVHYRILLQQFNTFSFPIEC